MSCRCAPAAWAAAAAAIAFCTIIRARPSKVAGSMCTYAIGDERLPSFSTISSPSGPCSRTMAFRPRRTHRSTNSCLAFIENRITCPPVCRRISSTKRVVGVQNGPAGLRHRLDDHLLHGGELLERLHLAQSEMVARHVQHHARRRSARSRAPRGGCRRAPPRRSPCRPCGFCSTICADFGPDASTRFTSRSSM